MSGATKDTIQKILLVALSAMTVSMVCISVFNYQDNKKKNQYLNNEKSLVQEELKEIIKNYDHLAKEHSKNLAEVNMEKKKAEELLDNLKHTALDYESILEYRTKMLELRKGNLRMQRKLHSGMSSGTMNTSF
ncbi:hypothetical protein KORDIASMS9_01580 [Kordia sp. SMS9]|uniref:hypothetical protein n=1 Tax=Kordia sp. SMS9 TaxID=2282170 RepID=UPI000E0DFA70|nr:hypothetical protein [Kordia sp. SMS9]AXG69360.1 hypothetical protein KORDIASMS9_01580 [Kordia sp. SMS9]